MKQMPERCFCKKTAAAAHNQAAERSFTFKECRSLLERGDLFFRAGVGGRILFHGDGSGKVDALYDRRNNEDVVWKKVE